MDSKASDSTVAMIGIDIGKNTFLCVPKTSSALIS